jgi:hypothetical protein
MAAITVAALRTALSGAASHPLLVRAPRMIGYHQIVSVNSSMVISNELYPDADSSSDNWLVMGLQPVIASGETPGSLQGGPSSRLPVLTDIMLVSDLLAILDTAYNSYRIAVSYWDGIFLCSDPIRVSIMTEYGSSNTTAAVLQLL